MMDFSVVWLFSVTRHGATWSTSHIAARTSTDGAEIWAQPVELTTEAGTMVRGKPIVPIGFAISLSQLLRIENRNRHRGLLGPIPQAPSASAGDWSALLENGWFTPQH